ncbi:adenosylcobinamide-phosphate synthase CbiB [Neptunomonas sp.]|uniref:adenosylcobinamide-phosphate synthase CbiB n=1 Tax=Neptunomonas sp. TaxID=1971898 RepID=UPI003564CFD2
MISVALLLGVLIDWLAGEPKRCHPLVGFGWLAQHVEHLFNLKRLQLSAIKLKLLGALALALLCFPLPLILYYWLPGSWESFGLYSVLNALLLYLAIGHRSLWDHIQPIADALVRQDDVSARHHTAMIVSRDPDALNIEVSAIESILENGSDAIFAAIFWFVIAGGAGAVFYRLVNTLDAMWGYRTKRYENFGWAAARLDDALNYLPARCTALSYAVLSDCVSALKCWKEQAPAHASPNGGPVIAAGAGGLGVLLGGPTRYQGVWQDKPVLGRGQLPGVCDIRRALRLVSQTLILWVVLICGAELFLLMLPTGGWR